MVSARHYFERDAVATAHVYDILRRNRIVRIALRRTNSAVKGGNAMHTWHLLALGRWLRTTLGGRLVWLSVRISSADGTNLHDEYL